MIFVTLAATTNMSAHGAVFLADNSAVSSAWQQTAGGAAPQVLSQADGETKIVWSTNVSADYHQTSASGGTTVQPLSDGEQYSVSLSSSVQATSPEGRLAYAQFMATTSNNRSVQRNQNSLQMVQAGVMDQGAGYVLSLGDAPVNFSSLGTGTSIRGLYGQKIIGQSSLSFAAGLNVTQAPTWNAAISDTQRSNYLRNVVAAKFDTPVGSNTRAYATLQGWADDTASFERTLSGLAPAESHSGTVGFEHQHDKLTVTSELGFSRFQEQDSASRSDSAFIIDAAWREASYSLQGGYHTLGKDYSAMSGAAQPGVEDTYVAGNWQATSWLALDGQGRRAKNQGAVGAVSISTTSTNMAQLGQTINFSKMLPGLSLALRETLSKGKNAAGGDDDQDIYDARLNYSTLSWNLGTSYTHQTFSTSAAASSNSETDTVGLFLLRTFAESRDNPTWTITPSFNASLQDQVFTNTGQNTRTTNWGVGINGSRVGWAEFSVNYFSSVIESTAASSKVNMDVYRVNVKHSFSPANSISLYVDSAQTRSALSGVSNDSFTVGLKTSVGF